MSNVHPTMAAALRPFAPPKLASKPDWKTIDDLAKEIMEFGSDTDALKTYQDLVRMIRTAPEELARFLEARIEVEAEARGLCPRCFETLNFRTEREWYEAWGYRCTREYQVPSCDCGYTG